jgi:outer membrane protein assembly factor BamE (lipoprotein component of BamABCDE complex)
MNKIIYFIIFLFISNCTFNKVIKHHGVHFLDKKQDKLYISKTNKNDILTELGPPSTKSTFDNDIWIYIERKTSKRSLFTLGKKKLYKNNVLVLEIDNKGLLVKKDFFDISDMNKLEFSEDKTTVQYTKNSFVYDFLSSVRQKVNDPLGKRKK